MLITKLNHDLIEIPTSSKIHKRIDKEILDICNDKPFINGCNYIENRNFLEFMNRFASIDGKTNIKGCNKKTLYAICDAIDGEIKICGCCEQHYNLLEEKGLLINKKIFKTQKQIDRYINIVSIMI